jgi:RNA recognition motif-containing protein
MGFNGSPFPLDPESIPRVVRFSFRSSIVGKKLYVGNLTYNVNESDLEALFMPFGTVQSAQVIVDRATNRSKGFGFVEMGSDAEAQAAISALNDHEHDGRRLTVNEAKPREERGGGGGGGRGGYGGGGGGGGRGGYGGGGGGGYGGGGGGGRRY